MKRLRLRRRRRCSWRSSGSAWCWMRLITSRTRALPTTKHAVSWNLFIDGLWQEPQSITPWRIYTHCTSSVSWNRTVITDIGPIILESKPSKPTAWAWNMKIMITFLQVTVANGIRCEALSRPIWSVEQSLPAKNTLICRWSHCQLDMSPFGRYVHHQYTHTKRT